MMIRITNLLLALFAAVTCYIAFMCYIQTKNYEVYINQLSDKLSLTNAEVTGNQEEIRILNKRIDEQNKRLTDQDNIIRIQNAQINEARARIERKHK